jgi:pyruvate/2-oxoglutarate dehydrogenase complex dihydrolipoamide acyltransferase (E2) component
VRSLHSCQLELVPPDTTVGDVVVVVGAVVGVVVVGEAVDPVVALDPDDPEEEAPEEEAPEEVAREEVACEEVACEEVACIETALLDAAPGISLATRPPKTAAVSAAPPVAIPVARLTLRMAADLCSAWSRGRIGSSSVDACRGLSRPISARPPGSRRSLRCEPAVNRGAQVAVPGGR